MTTDFRTTAFSTTFVSAVLSVVVTLGVVGGIEHAARHQATVAEEFALAQAGSPMAAEVQRVTVVGRRVVA